MMKAIPDGSKPVLGLRERKKVKTLNAIQAHALRLFREQGYEDTTMEQIAQAAEVSLSTIFRYFPTKEDLVLRDALDPAFFSAFRKQPAGLSPIKALRAAFHEAFTQISTVAEGMREREELMLAVPELRARMLDEFAGSLRFLVEVLAERTGHSSDDFAIQTLAGAVVGIVIAVWFMPIGKDKDYPTLVDEALAQLEAGFPL